MVDFKENVEEMVGRLAKRQVATESGGPRDETGDKTAATAGDEQDGGDRWVMYTDEGELEFDENEMAALEGQRLVAEFTRCTRLPGQSFIIDPVTNAANVKKALCI